MVQPVLQMKGITKSFQGIKVLNDAGLNVYPGKVMALLGENGAGKSTLMKVMAGMYSMEAGCLVIRGKQRRFSCPRDSLNEGISIVHQEPGVIPELSVAENIFLGREPGRKLGKVNWPLMFQEAKKLLDMLGVNIAPTELVGNLSIGLQQLVEIARGLSSSADIIVMDEPSDVLTEKETEKLFRVIRKLKGDGKAIVYISHRLQEISRICDYVTIMKEGDVIGEYSVSELTDEKLVELVIGGEVSELYKKVPPCSNELSLEVKEIYAEGFKNISFKLRKGEVLGLTGVMGAGITPLLKALYGINPIISGAILVNGKEVQLKFPGDGLANGIVYISKDRKKEGLVVDLSVQDNMSLSSLERFSCFSGTIRSKKERQAVKQFMHRFNIKMASTSQPVRYLSGGNQQKVVIAKGLMTNPKVLILDEPTRGIDVGAKKEIYRLINELKSQGVSVILASSDMPELVGMSDRVLVMRKGKITAEFTGDNISQKVLGGVLMAN